MTSPSPQRIRGIAWPILIVCLTFAVFSPVRSNGFIDWDDQANFVTNPSYRGLSGTHLTWMATTFHRGVYQPLAWVLAAVEYSVGGVEPWVYHAGSWLLHAVAAWLLYALSRRLFVRLAPQRPDAATSAAAAAALLWAIHPLRVEPVAWASAQGYPLAAVFALGSLLAWWRARDDRQPSGSSAARWSWVSVALAVCAYLAKPVAITLPAIILLLDWYLSPRETARWRTWTPWLSALPYAVPAALVAAAAPLARAQLGPASSSRYDVIDRLSQACYGIAYYTIKTVLPINLTVFTPLPQPFDPYEPRVVLAAAGLVSAGTIVIWAGQRARGAAACALAYLILLAPVLGLIRQGDQLVADRYSYFAGAPLAVALGVGLLTVRTRGTPRLARGLSVSAVGVIILFGALSWQLAHAWKNPSALWTRAVAVDPTSYHARINLGLAAYHEKRYDSALQEFDLAIRLNPRSSNAHFNRGLTLAKQGRTAEAIKSYLHGISLDPTDATAHAHLGDLLATEHRWPEAEVQYREAVRLAPNPDLYNSLGVTLAQQGRMAEAASAFRDALARDPHHADAGANLEMADPPTPAHR
ncbi:MAG: tetratricopeptide repeat protein [Nitrospirota bacterium]